jgi:hypothetical protein
MTVLESLSQILYAIGLSSIPAAGTITVKMGKFW